MEGGSEVAGRTVSIEVNVGESFLGSCWIFAGFCSVSGESLPRVLLLLGVEESMGSMRVGVGRVGVVGRIAVESRGLVGLWCSAVVASEGVILSEAASEGRGVSVQCGVLLVGGWLRTGLGASSVPAGERQADGEDEGSSC